jgi:hypothetical protein
MLEKKWPVFVRFRGRVVIGHPVVQSGYSEYAYSNILGGVRIPYHHESNDLGERHPIEIIKQPRVPYAVVPVKQVSLTEPPIPSQSQCHQN